MRIKCPLSPEELVAKETLPVSSVESALVEDAADCERGTLIVFFIFIIRPRVGGDKIINLFLRVQDLLDSVDTRHTEGAGAVFSSVHSCSQML